MTDRVRDREKQILDKAAVLNYLRGEFGEKNVLLLAEGEAPFDLQKYSCLPDFSDWQDLLEILNNFLTYPTIDILPGVDHSIRRTKLQEVAEKYSGDNPDNQNDYLEFDYMAKQNRLRTNKISATQMALQTLLRMFTNILTAEDINEIYPQKITDLCGQFEKEKDNIDFRLKYIAALIAAIKRLFAKLTQVAEERQKDCTIQQAAIGTQINSILK